MAEFRIYALFAIVAVAAFSGVIFVAKVMGDTVFSLIPMIAISGVAYLILSWRVRRYANS